MKSACVLALGLDATAALRVAPGAIRMQEVATAEPVAPPPLPKIKTMMVGDKTLAGDVAFDPLGLADSPDKLAWFREAEIKHARLAMLAALGWPLSEITNFGGLLTAEGRAPSLLNGGLGAVSSIYWAGVVALAVAAEAKGVEKQFGKKDDYLPGMLGFDPLGMDSDMTRNAEITNGRVAMLAITAYAYEEALTRSPIFPISLFSKAAEVGTAAVVSAASSTAAVLNSDGTFSIGGVSEVAAAEAAAAAAAAAAAEAAAPVAAAAEAVASAM